MEGDKFTNTSMSIKALLGLIEANDIAIPEIQRPFVWKNAQVRDLMDSLYKGFPTGYIILWKNPNVEGWNHIVRKKGGYRWPAAHYSDDDRHSCTQSL